MYFHHKFNYFFYYLYLKYIYLIPFSLMPLWNFRIIEHYKDAFFYLISILISHFPYYLSIILSLITMCRYSNIMDMQMFLNLKQGYIHKPVLKIW